MEAAGARYAEGVLKSSVGKLGSFLLNEALLIAKVREDIISIRDELQSMDAVLRDLICAWQLNHQNKVWMLHVLQVACDAELCIDEFTEILGGHSGHGFTGTVRRAVRFANTVIPRHRIAKTIKELKVRAKEVSERRARYSTTIQTNNPYAIELTRRAHEATRHLMQNWHLIAEDELVGIDSETWSKVTRLASKSGVTMIVGPAGSGKTALAKMVYRRRNDPNNGIKAFAWVTLSKKPDMKSVFVDILRQFNCFDATMEMDEAQLVEKLVKFLNERRFLLIVDSLCNFENWKEMKGGLLENSKGIIVVTTRYMHVANDPRLGNFCNVERIIEIGVKGEQFIGRDRKDLCAKLLNLTSVTTLSRDQWVREIMGWFNPYGLLHALHNFLWDWFAAQIWLHLCLIMVVWVLISHRVLGSLLSIVWTCFIGQHWTLTMVVLVLISFEDTRHLLRKSLGEQQALTMVILVSCSSQVLWNLLQGQVWLALSKATFIVMLLFFEVIKIQLNEIWRNLERKRRFLVVRYIIGIFFCINMTPFVFLYSIICWVVSFLDDYIVPQAQRIVKYQTRVEGVPLNMVHYYLRLTSSRILGVDSLVPLEVKFICGALACQRMDSNGVNTFIEKLDQLANNENDAKRLEEVILTCYNLVSESLKQCAQDLHQVLPKGCAAKRKRITMRWIAINLASPKQGQSSEEVAECYFEELQVRGFIEPESVYPTGKTRTCKINSVFKAIHPTTQQILSPNDDLPDRMQLEITKIGDRLLDELIPEIRLTNQQRDGVLVPLSGIPRPPDPIQCELTNSQNDLQGDDVPTQLTNISPKPTQSNLTKNTRENQQRSRFQFFDIQPSAVLKQFRKDYKLEYFKSLAVLDLEGCKSLKETDLSCLCQFVKLRFLSLRNTCIAKVPPNIGKLKQLETLDIRQTRIKKVPKDILHLKHLKRLLAGYFYKPESATGDSDIFTVRSTEMPVGMEEMCNLETLAFVNATRASNLLISVQKLTKLKKLGLVIQEGNLNSRPLCISLMMLSDSLRSLSVCDEREFTDHERVNSLDFVEYLCFPPLNLNSLTLSGYLGRLPQWVGNHKLLSKLTLANTHLRSNAIQLIGKIPTLLCLKFYRSSYVDASLNLERNEFAVLKVLIIHCDDIQRIRFEKGTTARLEVFRWVFSRAQIGEVSGIENLPMLKEVSLIGEVDARTEADIASVVRKHSNWETTLVFEKIKKEIRDNSKDS